ncbi:MAG: type II toxin-antitoxin system Phd/YefM family antitoxin [Spirochaetaceae bacterium]|nr:MAG: type II toxin-antitoxin system Phd/YefM family antitoxin [Spirochaetaceae bacterium]
MQTWSLQDAKARFSELVNLCLSEGPQMVTRHGHQAVVVVPASEFRPSDTRPLGEFLLTAPRVELQIDRQRDEGRKVSL